MRRFTAFLFDRVSYRELALIGAPATWGLACWLSAPLPISLLALPAPAHLALVAGLALLNLLAARALDGEPTPASFRHPRAAFLLRVSFAACAGAAAVGTTAALYLAGHAVGTLQAQAGTVAGMLAPTLLGSGFRPIATTVLALTLATVVYGYTRGARRRVVATVTVPVDGLPAALEGLRIAHVSDLHLGPLMRRDLLRRAFAEVTALAPDLVCVTGDIVDGPATDLASWVPELRAIDAPGGVYAILGNHDRRTGADRVATALARWTSWRVLRDEVATIEHAGTRLHLVGLEDRRRPFAAHLPALLARVPAGEPAIVLGHKPEVFHAAARAGVALTLAGHTHGGQVAVPGFPQLNVARVLLSRLDAGWFQHGRSLLHVSRGLGMSGQPLRVGVPAEITIITLRGRVAAAA
jgi:hypothetical protein